MVPGPEVVLSMWIRVPSVPKGLVNRRVEVLYPFTPGDTVTWSDFPVPTLVGPVRTDVDGINPLWGQVPVPTKFRRTTNGDRGLRTTKSLVDTYHES